MSEVPYSLSPEKKGELVRILERGKANRRNLLKLLTCGAIAGVGLLAAERLGFERACQAFEECGVTGESRVSKEYLDLVAKASDPSLVAGRVWSLGFPQASLAYSPDGVVARYINPEQGASHLVFIDPDDRNVTMVKNCRTGKIEFAGTDAAAVLQDAINALTDGGKIFVKRGTYVLSNSLTGKEMSGVELCGEGSATVFAVANGANTPVMRLVSVNDWHIHDIRVDGNKINQAGGVDPQLNGIDVYHGNSVAIENIFVRNCKTFGIQVLGSTNCGILNNHIADCGANGITVGNGDGGGGTLILGNTVTGWSDVAITTWHGINVVIANNIIASAILSESPFGGNGHIGIMQEQSSERVSVVNNHIENCRIGISTAPDTGQVNADISLEGNQVYNVLTGVYVKNTDRVLIRGNRIDTTEESGIVVDAPATNVHIVDNQLYNIGGSSGIEGAISGLMISGNMLKSISGNAIVAWGHDDWVITGNCIESTSNGGNGVLLADGCNNWIVSNNRISSCAGHGVLIAGSSSRNVVNSNLVSGCSGGVNIAASQAKGNVVTSNNLIGNKKALIDNGTGTTNANNIFE